MGTSGGHGKSSSRGGPWGSGEAGKGLGEGASGCGLIPSVFCPTPVPMDEPRRKSYHTMSGSVDLPHGSDGNSGGTETFGRTRGSGRGVGGEGQAGASGTGLISSMFSTAPVAMEEPRRKPNITGHMRASTGGIGSKRAVWAGGMGVESEEQAAKNVGLLVSVPSTQPVAKEEPRRPVISDVRSSGHLGRFGARGDTQSNTNEGASGRGLISGSSRGPVGVPQNAVNAWKGLAVSVSSTEGDEEELRGGKEANKRSPAGGGGG